MGYFRRVIWPRHSSSSSTGGLVKGNFLTGCGTMPLHRPRLSVLPLPERRGAAQDLGVLPMNAHPCTA